ncbi:MAG: type III-B CRISPR-associated protein Cas10/Cmr2 [candidate division WOR-3 bacterium]
MSNFDTKLKAFLHDPVDKCFDIPTHILRAKNYAEKMGVPGTEDAKGSDQIASCMERSLLPPKVRQDLTEIRHPLSDGKIDVPTFTKREIFESIENVFDQLGETLAGEDVRYKFLYLWRNLQEKIFESNRGKDWVKYLSLLPADTRVPDHSIWEHLKIATAVSAYWDEENNLLLQNNSLFLFSLGPVQSFISQARKAQDFYMGSFILSYLTFVGMQEIVREYGPSCIIYPELYKHPLMDWFLEKEFGITIEDSEVSNIDLPTIPNRFVAIVPETDKKKIQELANNLEKHIQQELNSAIEEILQKLMRASGFGEKLEDIKKMVKRHFINFPQIFWVAIPWNIEQRDVEIKDLADFFDNDEVEKWKELWQFVKKNGEFPPNIGLFYQLLYTSLEKSMGVRKNLRTFEQVWESGRKCSICGERNVLFFWETKNKNKFLRHNPDAIDLTGKVNPKFLSDGEGLCGLCFTKRTFELYLEEKVSGTLKNFSFPSTAEVATADFKEKALEKASKELEDFGNQLKECLEGKIPETLPLPKLKEKIQKTISGEWFFEENLRREFIIKEYSVYLDEKIIETLKGSLRTLTQKVGKPNPYYALIHLDGDNMGKWLSGELLPNIENAYNSKVWEELSKSSFADEIKNFCQRKLLSPAIHASISTALKNYALEFVRKIVEEEHLGKLIYAGGDDVLAYVNLKDLFDVMHKLRWAFSGQIKFDGDEIKVDLHNNTGFVEKDGRYYLTMGPKATASTGVVIAHYKTPLQIVIKKAFEMEELAKEKGRNGFAICMIRRSGEERVAKAKWHYDKNDTIEVLKFLAHIFDEKNENGYIAKGFIQKFASEFKNLKDKNGNFIAKRCIVKTEISRLLERSYNLPKGPDKEEIKRRSKEFLKNVSCKMEEFFWDLGNNINNFINFCIISRFVYKGED